MATTFTTDFDRCNLVIRGLTGAGGRLGWSVAKALSNATSWQGWIDAAPGPANRAARAALAERLMGEVQTCDYAEYTPTALAALADCAAWCVLTVETAD